MSEGEKTVASSSLPPPPPRARGDLTDDLIASSPWTDAAVQAAGIPVEDIPIVTIGGGLGSFALVDFLRAAGLSTDQIRVLGDNTVPSATYEYLARNSQIPRHERLRSDAGSVMDNRRSVSATGRSSTTSTTSADRRRRCRRVGTDLRRQPRQLSNTALVIQSATMAGLSEPSSSTVIERVVSTLVPFSTDSPMTLRSRTRAPDGTGVRNRTLSKP